MTILANGAPGLKRPGAFGKALLLWWGPHPLAQAALILAIVGLFWLLAASVEATMARIGVSPGFDFLGRSASSTRSRGSPCRASF